MHSAVARALKHCVIAPMTILRRPTDAGPGKPKGSLAMHPVEKDHILYQVWDKIMHGSVDNTNAATEEFMDKYEDFITVLPEFKIGDLTVEDFKNTCKSKGNPQRALMAGPWLT